MQKHGQTLIINSPAPGGSSSPTGSLSNRFAKIAQGTQKSGVVVVGAGGLETRPGKTLGLGFGTGIPPSQFQASGQRISTRGRGGSSHVGGSGISSRHQQAGGLVGAPTASIGKGGKILGIQTSAGRARAMQEKGIGASEDLLMNPHQPIIHEARASGRRRGPQLRGVGGAAATAQQVQQVKKTRASPYAAAAASRKAGPRKPVPTAPPAPAPAQSTTGAGAKGKSKMGVKGKPKSAKSAKPVKSAKSAKPVKSAKSAKPVKSAKSAKPVKPAKPAKATATSLDSDLTAYMMKHGSTASALLDNDLDTYMAEKPDDITF